MGQVGVAVLGYDLPRFPQHLPRRHVDERIEVRPTDGFGLRQERAWSVRELAQRADVSTETIYSLEHGRREWAWPRTVHKLADALGVEPKELMVGEEE
jgi:DNA-binding XRE family transcriptional regulator